MNSTGPRMVCIGCESTEVGMYELLCPPCRKVLEHLGIVDPPNTPTNNTPDHRIQIGPTDI